MSSLMAGETLPGPSPLPAAVGAQLSTAGNAGADTVHRVATSGPAEEKESGHIVSTNSSSGIGTGSGDQGGLRSEREAPAATASGVAGQEKVEGGGEPSQAYRTPHSLAPSPSSTGFKTSWDERRLAVQRTPTRTHSLSRIASPLLSPSAVVGGGGGGLDRHASFSFHSIALSPRLAQGSLPSELSHPFALDAHGLSTNTSNGAASGVDGGSAPSSGEESSDAGSVDEDNQDYTWFASRRRGGGGGGGAPRKRRARKRPGELVTYYRVRINDAAQEIATLKREIVEELVGEAEGKEQLQELQKKIFTIAIGEDMEIHSGNDWKPYVGRLLELDRGKRRCKVQWFFTQPEVTEPEDADIKEKEVLLSAKVESLGLDTIKRKATVVRDLPSERDVLPEATYFCVRGYDFKKKVTLPLQANGALENRPRRKPSAPSRNRTVRRQDPAEDTTPSSPCLMSATQEDSDDQDVRWLERWNRVGPDYDVSVPAWEGPKKTQPKELFVTKARLNDQKQWPANSMGLTKEVLESYLTRAESIAPIIPGTLVYLRPRRDGTWGDGLDKGIVKPRRGVVSSHQGGGSSGEFGSRGSVSRVTPSRLRWGLVSEHSPPLPRQHEGGLAGSLAAATAAGVATGVAPGLLSTSQLGYASLTVAAAAAAASSKRGGSCCGGRGGIGDVEVCIVNPRGKEVPPLLVEKWRVVRRDFEDDALKALADTQGDTEAALAWLSSSKFLAGARKRIELAGSIWTTDQVAEACEKCSKASTARRSEELGDQTRDEIEYDVKPKKFSDVVDFARRFKKWSRFGQPVGRSESRLPRDNTKHLRSRQAAEAWPGKPGGSKRRGDVGVVVNVGVDNEMEEEQSSYEDSDNDKDYSPNSSDGSNQDIAVGGGTNSSSIRDPTRNEQSFSTARSSSEVVDISFSSDEEDENTGGVRESGRRQGGGRDGETAVPGTPAVVVAAARRADVRPRPPSFSSSSSLSSSSSPLEAARGAASRPRLMPSPSDELDRARRVGSFKSPAHDDSPVPGVASGNTGGDAARARKMAGEWTESSYNTSGNGKNTTTNNNGNTSSNDPSAAGQKEEREWTSQQQREGDHGNSAPSSSRGEGGASRTSADDMRMFMERVQSTLDDEPFDSFVEGLKSYRQREVTVEELVKEVAVCFDPLQDAHMALVSVFNSYLPPGIALEYN